MADLPDLSGVSGQELTREQIQGILNQIDLDIYNMLLMGQGAALKYTQRGTAGGAAGAEADRSVAINALRQLRDSYQRMLDDIPFEAYSQYDDPAL